MANLCSSKAVIVRAKFNLCFHHIKSPHYDEIAYSNLKNDWKLKANGILKLKMANKNTDSSNVASLQVADYS